MKNNDNDKLIDENKDEERIRKTQDAPCALKPELRKTNIPRLWNSPNPAV